ncbi:hypothetical protein [Enterococcus faecium]|uniref:hypothetical protein n=1 Tax=Enterococcus faecium TaxID=1352 RepID=UPI00145ACB4B|nr:hypothetical protein [Enterococcus faecium]NMO62285.1 hypothetical protein [Enterococcus faecium]HCR2860307.1 hypothetical protein [Enterococcus faecium]
MSTEKKRKKYAFSDETIEKLDWLVKEHQKRSKKRIYPCHTLSELINNEYLIRKSFGNS